MFCDHVNWQGKNQTFKRVCEWNKHMDRHERPHKCLEAKYELNPRFTYSGGVVDNGMAYMLLRMGFTLLSAAPAPCMIVRT